MKHVSLALLAVAAASPLAAETREMSAHVHGVSTLELAIEHGHLEINMLSPGMDIVGFEAASADEDLAQIEAAIHKLSEPGTVVTLPEAAKCRLTGVLAHIHAGDHDHDHEEGEHEHEAGHDHEEGHDHEADHDHKEGHDHEEGHAHEGEDHDHASEEHHDEDHHDEGGHSEFHVRYSYTCADEDALTSMDFPFFANFANAQKVEAQYVTETGTGAVDITRESATLSLK